jgi:protein-disulfide isomerase
MREHLESEIPTPKRSGITPTLAGLLGLVTGLLLGLIVGLTAPKTSSKIIAGSPTMLKPIVIETTVNGQRIRVVGKPMGDVSGNSRYSIGDPNAKIIMTEFADFKCGYCRLFATETLTQIKKEFIDSGKIRFVYRDMITVGGNEALRAASAAACVFEAGSTKYWGFHNLLYGAAHDSWASLTGLNLDNKLIEIAGGVGANTASVKTCLTTQKYLSQIQIDNQLGADLELGGTPAFVVGGYFFSGALPLEAWREVFKALGVA